MDSLKTKKISDLDGSKNVVVITIKDLNILNPQIEFCLQSRKTQ